MSKSSTLGVCRLVVGPRSGQASELLYRLSFWSDRAYVERDGYKWIAFSRDSICQQTGLTLKQYVRAISFLKKHELVIAEQHFFGRKNIAHLRLTDKVLQLIATKKTIDRSIQECPNGHTLGSAQMVTLGSAQMGTLNIKTIKKDDIDEIDTNVSTADAIPKQKKDKVTGMKEKKESMFKAKSMTIAEAIKAGPSVVYDLKPDKAENLAFIWRKKLAAEFQQDYFFTGKEYGNLKHLSKVWGSEAQFVLKHVIEFWPTFVDLVVEQDGAHPKSCPATPKLAWLHSHMNVGLNMFKKQITGSTGYVAVKAYKPLSDLKNPSGASLLPSQTPPDYKVHTPATAEEVQAMMDAKD